MKYYKINGGYSLSGDVYIGGSKNSSLPIICASLIIKQKVRLYNVPKISDVYTLLEIIKLNGVLVYENDNYIEIDATNISSGIVDTFLCSKLRASYYLLGALINRFDNVSVRKQGGCNIGDRPIDIHRFVFEQLGYRFGDEDELYSLHKGGYCNGVIRFNNISMGATINGILAALSLNKDIRLENVSIEPEIDDLISFLNLCGYFVTRKDDVIAINKDRKKVDAINYKIMFDRIEAGSYAILSSLVGNNVRIHNFVSSNNTKLLEIFNEMGIDYSCENNILTISKSSNIKPINIVTGPYPEFATDLIQMLSVLMINGEGISSFKDTVYRNRYAQLLELVDYGIAMNVYDDEVFVYGNKVYNNGVFYGKDLRGTMALVMYALKSEGESLVYGIEYLERGYDSVVNKLLDIGACIEVIEYEK